MNGIEPVKILTIFIVFTLISFASKFVLFTTAGTLLVNIFPDNSMFSVYFTIILSIFVSGLVVGKAINVSVHANPLAHGLIVAGLAGVYKSLRPELDPLPGIFVGIFALLNFAAIILGAHIAQKK